jgi:hypothetical protein
MLSSAAFKVLISKPLMPSAGLSSLWGHPNRSTEPEALLAALESAKLEDVIPPRSTSAQQVVSGWCPRQ